MSSRRSREGASALPQKMVEGASRVWPLIETRLRPPLIRHPVVERTRLLDLLDSTSDCAVTLISAPAGYGKTTLLAQWYGRAREQGVAAGWVSLDEMEDDPVRFLRYVARGFAGAAPASVGSLRELLHADFNAQPGAALTLLVNEIARVEDDVYLVIEDVHLLRSSETLAIFDRLINESIERVHFLLSCRDIPPISLARLRMRRGLLEIDAGQLQFAAEETADYVRVQAGVRLSTEQVADLHAKTDGWIAGLQLAMLSLRQCADPQAVIAEFSGSHRNVVDLLAEEVLSRQDDATLDFLLTTCILSPVEATVCEALTGKPDAAATLQRLEQSNLFLFPVDDNRIYYRYHGLFADVLKRVLDERYPGRAAELHRRAAKWYADHELPVRAVDHALKSGDADFTAGILDAAAMRMLTTGKGASLLAYAARIPDEVAADYPRLQLQRVYAATLAWRFELAGAILRSVRRGLADATQAMRWEARGVDADQIYHDLVHREGQLALLADEMPKAARLCREWLDSEGDKTAFETAVTRTSLLYAQREQYDVAHVETASAIRKLFEDEGNRWATIWHDTIIGACHAHMGQLQRAESLYKRALATAHHETGQLSATAAIPALCLAQLEYEFDHVDNARALLESYLALGAETGLVDQLVAAYVTVARLERLASPEEPAVVFKVLDQGESLARSRGFERLSAHLLLERISLLVDAGQLRQALQVARAGDLAGDPDVLMPGRDATTIREIRAIAWALVSLSRNRGPEAITLLERWHAYVQSRRCVRSAVRLGVWLARAHLLAGDARKAQRWLRTALLEAGNEPFVRTFLDGGAPICGLLERMSPPDGEESRHAFWMLRERLLAAFGTASRPVVPEPSVRHVSAETLGPRELEILVRVARGSMNSQIADELGLTVGTVKWYMQQIFGKLSVTRRSQAVHRARQLGIIR